MTDAARRRVRPWLLLLTCVTFAVVLTAQEESVQVMEGPSMWPHILCGLHKAASVAHSRSVRFLCFGA